MTEQDSLTELTREIMAQGFDEEKASELAVLIGDTPCFDATGNVVVMDGSRRVTTLKPLKFFSAV
jgi:hypothetical protein